MRDFQAQVPNFEPATGDYPNGKIRDTAGPTPGTGVVEALYGDIVQFFLKLMIDAGLTANTLPENVGNGYQLIDAIVSKAREALTGGTLTDANDASFSGFFECTAATANIPAVQAGTLIHTAIGIGVSSASQMFNSTGGTQLYTRRKLFGSWLPWVELAQQNASGNFVVEPLAGINNYTTVVTDYAKYSVIGNVMTATAYFTVTYNSLGAAPSVGGFDLQTTVLKPFGDDLRGVNNSPGIPNFTTFRAIGDRPDLYVQYAGDVSAKSAYLVIVDGGIADGDSIKIAYQGSYIMQ